MADFKHDLRVSTPGRICLFGEHQDYLHLPVIPCAISLRISIEGSHTTGHDAEIELPDIGGSESFPLAELLPYQSKRDYFRSCVNVLLRNGFTFSRGIHCVVRGNIPINSGTSSSSALLVTWVNFLACMSDQGNALSPQVCARLAHAAEVLEFGEPGGMMDHYSTALGGIIALDFFPDVRFERLAPPLGTFVLGDSGQPKDTVRILSMVKDRILGIVERLRTIDPSFSLQSVTMEEVLRLVPTLTQSERDLLYATLLNRDLTVEARRLFKQSPFDHQKMGELLNEHQAMLRDVLGISTPKIDRMIDAAVKAGALGGKINGSGGGGCMFVYAPENPESVAEAIELAGGKAYIVQADEGTRCESVEVAQ